MRWRSWITIASALTILSCWLAGYWFWQQALRHQLQQQQTSFAQQLELSHSALINWQQGYRLNLAYLQRQLADWDPVSHHNPVLDPWLEIDNALNQALWPQPFTAYAILDVTGKVVRLSSPAAGDLFAKTQTGPIAEFFLPPLVFEDVWLIPMIFRVNNHSIMLWFDAGALQHQIKQQLGKPEDTVELQLLSREGELLTPSQYRHILRQRLGQMGARPFLLDKFYAKKPPADLTLSRQKFDSSAAWSLTDAFILMQQQPNGLMLEPFQNYLGRSAFAVWRWSDAWQAFIVIERDATDVLEAQRRVWRYGLLALLALSMLIGLGCWLLQRRILKAAQDAVAARLTE